MDERSRYRQFEEQFLRQLRARAQGLLRQGIPADQFALETVSDGIDGVRAALMRHERYERDLLETLPGTRAVQMRFQRRVFGPFFKTVARLRALSLPPLEALLTDSPAGPVGREQVLDALARYDLMPQAQRPTAVALASPTGFSDEAKALVHTGTGLTLILLGGRSDGGWDIEMPLALRRQPWARLFELESQDERLKRLMYHLEKNIDQLESRGISVPELADKLGLPREQVEGLVHQACRQDTRLMTVVHDGTVHLSRSPLADEVNTMSMLSRWQAWIRRILRLKPSVTEQVRTLTAQRVQLEQHRHEVDQRANTLEAEEREAVEKGIAAKTDVERKQLAGKLTRTRRELRRVRAQANMYTQQIDIIGTHIHHLTLAEQGKRVALPSGEELAKEAAQAEQLMAELTANAELATSIEVGVSSPLMDEEEQAIFEEFKQAAADRSAAPTAAPASASKTPGQAQGAPATPIPQTPADKSKARPEAT